MPHEGVVIRASDTTQAMAEHAAFAAGLPFADAARFGAAALRHLAEGRDPRLLSRALARPEALKALSAQVSELIEAASLGHGAIPLANGHDALTLSYLESLPCKVKIERDDMGLRVTLSLVSPTASNRRTSVNVPDSLWSEMEAIIRTARDRGEVDGMPRGSDLMDLR